MLAVMKTTSMMISRQMLGMTPIPSPTPNLTLNPKMDYQRTTRFSPKQRSDFFVPQSTSPTPFPLGQ